MMSVKVQILIICLYAFLVALSWENVIMMWSDFFILMNCMHHFVLKLRRESHWSELIVKNNANALRD